MKLTLIGMSGSGKTYWSKKLKKLGFQRICCDDLIEEKLGSELKKLDYSGIRDVAKWMGQPFENRYKKASRLYLNCESEAIKEILATLGSNEDIVVDTTGSVIYLESSLLNKLSNKTKMVYLVTPSSVRKQMYELYFKDPKPVFWGNSFSKLKGESDFEALARCYPKLLAFRTKKYQRLADFTFDYQFIHDPNFTITNFLELVK